MDNFIGKGTVSLFGFLGAIVILLWGVRTIRKGIENALLPYGHASNKIFQNKGYALFAGMFGAALLQSSTALVLIVSSVATKITIPLSVGLAFVLGADVGTSIAAQLFTFNIQSVGPLLLFVGFFIQRVTNKDHSFQRVGQVLMGFGFVLYGLSSIGQISSEIRNSDALSNILSIVLVNDVALALLISILLTWLSHSSLAIVLMTIQLVSSQVIPIDLGISLILGANIGACFPAYTDSIGQPVEARRLTFGNIIFRVVGGILIIPILKYITTLAENTQLSPARFLAMFHLIFNSLVALLFIFFTKQIANFIMKIFPEPEQLSHKGISTKFLRTADITNSTLAITNLVKETSRLSDYVYVMVDLAHRALEKEVEIKEIHKTEEYIDSLYRSISNYLQKVYSMSLNKEQAFSTMLIHTYCTDLEQIGDVISNSLSESLTNKHKKHIPISNTYKVQLDKLFAILKENINLSQNVFRTRSVNESQELLRYKVKFKKIIVRESQKHKQLLLEGAPDSITINAIFLDMINDLKRINAHISSIAHPIMDEIDLTQKH